MSRVADSTIKGFLYQFNITLKNILESSNDNEIQVEGIIEDIDIIAGSQITAIQCKYHESQENFKLSTIYKPVLQMLKNYTLNPDAKINYILYAFFPSMCEGIHILSEQDINEILDSNNIDYICNYIVYIKPCDNPSINKLIEKVKKTSEDKKKIKAYYVKNKIEVKSDLKSFFSSKFCFKIGRSYRDIEEEVKQLLIAEDFSEEDVKEIFYPNAIQKIAEISTNKIDNERIVNKNWLIKDLRNKKKTAITRWTKELTDYKKLLKIRRNQLSTNFNENYRKRCFILEANDIENFDNDIVIFLKDFVDTYCHKVKLHRPAIFCIDDYSKDKIDDLISRLYSKNVIVEDGYKGNTFFKEAFIKEPETKVSESWIQFVLRLSHGMPKVYEVINKNKPDDIFIIGNRIPNDLDLKDVNVELLDVMNFSELRYLFKLESEVR